MMELRFELKYLLPETAFNSVKPSGSQGFMNQNNNNQSINTGNEKV